MGLCSNRAPTNLVFRYPAITSLRDVISGFGAIQ